MKTHCVCETEVSFFVPILLAIFSSNATFRCNEKYGIVAGEQKEKEILSKQPGCLTEYKGSRDNSRSPQPCCSTSGFTDALTWYWTIESLTCSYPPKLPPVPPALIPPDDVPPLPPPPAAADEKAPALPLEGAEEYPPRAWVRRWGGRAPERPTSWKDIATIKWKWLRYSLGLWGMRV